MKYCTKCNLSVNTGSERCPLCSSILTGIDGGMGSYKPSVGYPKRTIMQYKYNFSFRLFLFLSIVIGTTCLLINILTYSGILWSLIVIGSILCLWVVILYPCYKRRKIGHIIIVDATSISVLLYLIQIATHTKGWGVDFVIPFLLIAATSIITFIIILKKMKWVEYSVYQLIMVILGLLPLIICIFGLASTTWPSIVSAFYSILTLTGMFVFADKKYKNELTKRFHL